MGTVITMPISGVLCEYVDWESVFYITGKFALLFQRMRTSSEEARYGDVRFVEEDTVTHNVYLHVRI